MTEDEAIREGIARGPLGGYIDPTDDEHVEFATALRAFRAAWDRINVDTPWASNPNVFRIDLGPRLTREEATRLAAIKDVEERLRVAS